MTASGQSRRMRRLRSDTFCRLAPSQIRSSPRTAPHAFARMCDVPCATCHAGIEACITHRRYGECPRVQCPVCRRTHRNKGRRQRTHSAGRQIQQSMCEVSDARTLSRGGVDITGSMVDRLAQQRTRTSRTTMARSCWRADAMHTVRTQRSLTYAGQRSVGCERGELGPQRCPRGLVVRI